MQLCWLGVLAVVCVRGCVGGRGRGVALPIRARRRCSRIELSPSPLSPPSAYVWGAGGEVSPALALGCSEDGRHRRSPHAPVVSRRLLVVVLHALVEERRQLFVESVGAPPITSARSASGHHTPHTKREEAEGGGGARYRSGLSRLSMWPQSSITTSLASSSSCSIFAFCVRTICCAQARGTPVSTNVVIVCVAVPHRVRVRVRWCGCVCGGACLSCGAYPVFGAHHDEDGEGAGLEPLHALVGDVVPRDGEHVRHDRAHVDVSIRFHVPVEHCVLIFL